MPQIVAEHVQLIMNKRIYTASLSGLQFKIFNYSEVWKQWTSIIFIELQFQYPDHATENQESVRALLTLNMKCNWWGKRTLKTLFDDDEIPADMSKKETIVYAASKNITAVKEILKYCIILF